MLGSVRSVPVLAVVAIAVAVLGGCGGSGSSKTAVPAAGSAATTTSVSSAATTQIPATSTTAQPSSTAGTHVKRPSAPTGGAGMAAGAASAAGGGARGRANGPGGGAINARVPAAFRLSPGGRLSPTTVSAPAFLAVSVMIASDDGSSHTVVIGTPSPRTLTIARHGSGVTLIPGLRAGDYPITVDGARRAVLIIGGEPGP